MEITELQSVSMNNLSQDEVTRLHALYVEGDDSAGWALVQSVQKLLMRQIHRYFPNRSLGEDLLSEINIRLFTALKNNYNPKISRLTTFAVLFFARRSYRIANNRTFKLLSRGSNDDDGASAPIDYATSEPSSYEIVLDELSAVDEAIRLTRCWSPMETAVIEKLASGATSQAVVRWLDSAYPEWLSGVYGRSVSAKRYELELLVCNAIESIRDELEVSQFPPALECLFQRLVRTEPKKLTGKPKPLANNDETGVRADSQEVTDNLSVL